MQPAWLFIFNWLTHVQWANTHCMYTEQSPRTEFIVLWHCTLVDMICTDVTLQTVKFMWNLSGRQRLLLLDGVFLKQITDFNIISKMSEFNYPAKLIKNTYKYRNHSQKCRNRFVGSEHRYRFVVIMDFFFLPSLEWVYSPILRVGNFCLPVWKETGCAYLWMKGLAWTLHPNEDHDPIWLPRHMVLFLRQRESLAGSHLSWTEWAADVWRQTV